MIWLILGLLLWSGSHLFKRIAPERRAAIGDKGKAVVALLSVAAIALMVIGYRNAAFVELWTPPAFLTHVNNLLMLVAVFLVNLGFSRGVLRTKMRHPMLIGTKTWAIAHLLVNGDLASVVLFGGLLGWAVASVILINRANREWVAPKAGPWRNDLIYAAVSVAIFALIGGLHSWLGPWPFG